MTPATMTDARTALAGVPGTATTAAPTIDRARTDAVVDAAVRRIAPLWPLERFVAVNPWVGMADHDFREAALRSARTAGAHMTMPRSWFAAQIATRRIADRHLETALERARTDARSATLATLPVDVPELRRRVAESTTPVGPETDPGALLLPTVADAAELVTGRRWERLVRERLSLWAGSWIDDTQASWSSPWKESGAWDAWRAEATIDRTPELLGVTGFRETVESLPSDAGEAVLRIVRELGLPEEGLELYLHRLLMRVGGWSARLRYHLWEAELHGGRDSGIHEWVAILLAWELALARAFEGRAVDGAWRELRAAYEGSPGPRAVAADIALDLVLQDALELARQEEMVARFDVAAGVNAARSTTDSRPSVQAAFCIDVRSEVFRRALESQSAGVQTLGFAGFFGFALEYVPVGSEEGRAQCPVLLTPGALIEERAGADAARTEALAARRTLRRAALDVWKSFKMGAVTCFGFVGPVGLAYARKLVTDGFGWTRPVPHPAADALKDGEQAALAPDLTPGSFDGRTSGMDAETRLASAEAVLRAMSLTETFGRIVLLAGHGSTTVNNPHATGLDCGACGGHTGEANARVAAAVLNDPAVRAGLKGRGIDVPEDTLFLAGLHDTTTDEVTLFGLDGAPSSHAPDIARLREQLAAAGRLARAERAPDLGFGDQGRSFTAVEVRGLPGAAIDEAVDARSRNWSEVRPEWGLAGCAAFVAAPRHRTAGMDLEGRSFLHDYSWERDDGFDVLELIMTAPMVVASWISLQYYGSTVDNRVYGSGNKTLHNVVAGMGVLEGNGGDLRTGLPWQSVHDGEQPMHEPLRLNVVIEAPLDAMTRIIEAHEGVRDLLDNGWLHLWAMDAEGRIGHRYAGGLEWERVARSEVATA